MDIKDHKIGSEFDYNGVTIRVVDVKKKKNGYKPHKAGWRDRPLPTEAPKMKPSNFKDSKKPISEFQPTTYTKYIVRATKNRAKRKGLPFDLTYKWTAAHYTGFCELTGLPFDLTPGKRSLYSPSLDRIDNSKGYTQDNCRFILWGLNAFKSDSTDEDIKKIARALLKPEETHAS